MKIIYLFSILILIVLFLSSLNYLINQKNNQNQNIGTTYNQNYEYFRDCLDCSKIDNCFNINKNNNIIKKNISNASSKLNTVQNNVGRLLNTVAKLKSDLESLMNNSNNLRPRVEKNEEGIEKIQTKMDSLREDGDKAAQSFD